MKNLLLISCIAANCLAASLVMLVPSSGQSQTSGVSSVDVPHLLSYQGLLRTADGSVVKDGTTQLTVHMYTDAEGRTEIWQGTYSADVVGGVFHIDLGSGATPLPSIAAMSRPLWLGTNVGESAVMKPLTPLEGAPYALTVADQSITAEKMATDYVGSIEVNGQPISERGGSVNLQGGQGIRLAFDQASHSIVVSNTSANAGGRGTEPQTANPMTTLGDMVYGGSGGAETRLAGNTSSTRKFFNQTGTGSASAAPSWNTITANDVPNLENLNGLLPVGSGGTGATTIASHGIVLGNGTGALTAQTLSNGQLLIGSTGNNPAAATLSGTTNQVTVTNGAGSVTLSTPQDIATSSSPSFANTTLSGTMTSHGLSLAGATSPITLNGSNGTSGQLLTSNAAGTPSWSSINGTANRVTVSNAGGAITLSGPQDLASASSPTFNNMTLTGSLTTQGLSLSGGSGNSGQLLTATGTGSDAWCTMAGTPNRVLINASAGTMTLSTPQDIGTSSSPTFNNLTLTGGETSTSVSTGALTATTVSAGAVTATSVSTNGLTIGGVGGTSGQLFASNGNGTDTWKSVNGTPNQVNVVSGANSITLSGPQDLATTSSPTFNNLTLNGSLTVAALGVNGLVVGGSGGTVGQILSSNGNGTDTWTSVTGTPNRVTVSNAGGIMTISGPQDLGAISSPSFTNLTLAGTATTHGVALAGATSPISLNGSTGSQGQILTSNGSNTDTWTSIGGTANQVIVTSGPGSFVLSTPQDIATSSSPSFNNMTLAGTATTHGVSLAGSSSPVTANGSTGSAGQVLTSTGSGTPVWAAAVPSGAVITMSSNAAVAGYTAVNYEQIVPNSGWSRKQDMITHRYYSSAAVVNGKVYVIGGSGDAGTIGTVEAYDPSTNTWATKATMPTARYFAASAVINGKIYVVGGTSDNIPYLQKLECYDPATNTWSTKADMPTGRYLLGAAAVSGKLYAVGGYNGDQSPANLSNVECYDPSTNTWSTVASLSQGRYAFGCAATSTKLYAMGGYGDAGYLDETQEYNPSTDSWSSKATMPEQRYYNNCVLLNNVIYDIGGYNASTAPALDNYYDPSDNTWHQAAQSLSAHIYGSLSATGSKIYLTGAYSDGVEEYDPTAEIDLYYFKKN